MGPGWAGPQHVGGRGDTIPSRTPISAKPGPESHSQGHAGRPGSLAELAASPGPSVWRVSASGRKAEYIPTGESSESNTMCR